MQFNLVEAVKIFEMPPIVTKVLITVQLALSMLLIYLKYSNNKKEP